MYKAFIFDLDGVIINSEPTWRKREEEFLPIILGSDVYKEIKKDIFGSTYYKIYDMAKKNGSQVTQQDFYKKYNEEASKIYQQTPLTKDIELLIKALKKSGIKIGLVSASRMEEIKTVLNRTRHEDIFEVIISLDDRKDLRPKPFPDGYIEAMHRLEVTALETVILEDSNKGIAAAKASGALTICLREHLSEDYISEGADYYLKNIKEVMQFLNL